MKTELTIILFSILILIGLGIRADIETDIRATACRIAELEGQVITKTQQIRSLNEQLLPPPYSQPVDKIIITSQTGVRQHPFLGGGNKNFHKGNDLAGKIGDPVYTILAGKVVGHWLPPGFHGGVWYKGHPTFGGCIIIKHESGLHSLYGHFSATCVHEGDWVEMGQKIGEIGSTGRSTGPHVHWELIIDGFKFLNECVLTKVN